MGLDTSFIIIIDDKHHFIDFINEKQKEEYQQLKNKKLVNEKITYNMNYWYPEDLKYSHEKLK